MNFNPIKLVNLAIGALLLIPVLLIGVYFCCGELQFFEKFATSFNGIVSPIISLIAAILLYLNLNKQGEANLLIRKQIQQVYDNTSLEYFKKKGTSSCDAPNNQLKKRLTVSKRNYI
jgi:hypothetical protein